MTVVDLSNNNPEPSFNYLKNNGVTGVMLKVSEGATFKDPKFSDWARRARAQGLRVGGYHFAQPNGGDPNKEAAWFAKNLGPLRDRDFRPALDLEANPGGLSWHQLVDWSRAFNQEVFRLSGTLPMLYASKSWIQSMHADVPIGAALWLAWWSDDNKPFPISAIAPWKKPASLHQYTSHGFVGKYGRVDLNRVVTLRPLLAFPDRNF